MGSVIVGGKVSITINGIPLDVADGATITTGPVIDLVHGEYLDLVGEKYGLTRDWKIEGNNPVLETDDDFRRRILKAAGGNQCSHDWIPYDSGWTKYYYCKHCDVRKN